MKESGHDRRREFWLPAAGIFGVPVLTGAMSFGIIAAAGRLAPSSRSVELVPFVNAAIAAVGSAGGGLLIPKPLAGRVAYAVICFPLGFFLSLLVFSVAAEVAGLP